MNSSHGKLALRLVTLAVGLSGCLMGCVDYNNRPPPTQAEVKQADDKRQSYIDSVPNLTAEQKAQMKAHMGGPAAPGRGGPSAGPPPGQGSGQ